MKKSIILLILFVFSFLCDAQIGLPDWFTFGPRAGFVINKIDYQDDEIHAGLKNDFSVGLFARFYPSTKHLERLYIEPGITYSRLNGYATIDTNVIVGEARNLFTNMVVDYVAGLDPQSLEYLMLSSYFGTPLEDHAASAANMIFNQFGIGNLEADLKTHTLQFPLMLGVHLGKMHKMTSVSLFAGPVLNVFIKDKTILKGSFAEILGQDAVQFDLNKVTWGIQGGVSVDIQRFTISANFHYGLNYLFGGKNGIIVDHDIVVENFKPYFIEKATEITYGLVNIEELIDVDDITEKFYEGLRDVDTGDMMLAKRYSISITLGYRL